MRREGASTGIGCVEVRFAQSPKPAEPKGGRGSTGPMMGSLVIPQDPATPGAPTRLLLQCRRCGAPVDPGAKAALLATNPRLLLDCACEACGHRALYSAA